MSFAFFFFSYVWWEYSLQSTLWCRASWFDWIEKLSSRFRQYILYLILSTCYCRNSWVIYHTLLIISLSSRHFNQSTESDARENWIISDAKRIEQVFFSYNYSKGTNNNNNNDNKERMRKKDFFWQQHTDDDKILSFVHREIHMESNVRRSARKCNRIRMKSGKSNDYLRSRCLFFAFIRRFWNQI